MKKLIAVFSVILLTTSVTAQVTLGSIKGRVLDGDEDNKPIYQARVWVETDGGDLRITKTDFEGRFIIEALKPGVYNLYAKAVGKDTVMYKEVEVKPEFITTLDDISATYGMLGPVEIVYTPPLIKKEINRLDINTKDIEHSPNIRNPKALIASFSSEITIPEGTNEVIIRGSRPGDVIYYVDGVKSDNLNGVPGAAIGSMNAYTGGVPAKYGDTMGGVISLESKSYFDLYYAWKAKQ